MSKTHTTDIDSFQPVNAECLGTVRDGVIASNRPPTARQPIGLNADRPVNNRLCRVDMITMYPGADRALLKAAIAAGAKGIVIQGLGAGNVNLSLFGGIAEAIKVGIKVVVASRVPRGAV